MTTCNILSQTMADASTLGDTTGHTGDSHDQDQDGSVSMMDSESDVDWLPDPSQLSVQAQLKRILDLT